MRHLRLIASIAMAAAVAASPALSQTRPFQNPTYIPTAVLAPASLSAPGSVSFQTGGSSVVTLRVSGTCTNLAATVQGSNEVSSPAWTNLELMPVGGGSEAASISGTGFWSVNTAGLAQVRVNATVLTAACTFAMAGSGGSNGVTILNPSAFSGTVAVDQGTPGTTNGVALAQIGSTTTSADNGTADAGTQRVAIASDNTPFAVKVDQTTPGTTNAVAIDQTTPGTTNSVALDQTTPGTTNAVAVDQTTPGTTNAIAVAQVGSTTVAADNGVAGAGVQRVVVASDQTPYSVKIDQTTPGTTNLVATAASTIGGASSGKIISAASTNSTAIKAGAAGTLYTVIAVSVDTTDAYLKFYDTAAAPTCNTDTVVMTIALSENSPVAVNLGPHGVAFANGIGACITGAAADNDNTNATTGITVSVVYE